MAAPAFAPKDYIAAGADATLAKTLRDCRADPANAPSLAGFPPGETEAILFADNVTKINRYGTRQMRTVVITSLAVFNFKPKAYKSFQRRVAVSYMDALWLIRGTNELGEAPCR
jgi:hypothetical protein